MPMRIVITGGNGLVATELTHLLLSHTNYDIVLISRNTSKVNKVYENYIDRIKCFTLDDFIESGLCHEIEVVIHTAFSRSEDPKEIASSLKYLTTLCAWSKRTKVKRFVNISSQSVYGTNYKLGIKEDGLINPQGYYALGKISSEYICETAFKDSGIQLINVRLSSVCENARFIKIFVENVLTLKPIIVSAPQQIVSFIDVRDVATALLKVIEFKKDCSGTYNLGSNEWYTILQCAETVIEIAKKNYELNSSPIEISENGNNHKVGMNTDKFRTTFDWNSKFDLPDMIISVFEMLKFVNGGGNVIPYFI